MQNPSKVMSHLAQFSTPFACMRKLLTVIIPFTSSGKCCSHYGI